MKKSMKYVMATMILMFGLFIQTIYGCWVAYTIEEMDEMADLIIIGEFRGSAAEVKPDNELGIGRTNWIIHNGYVIKGEFIDKTVVSTPGAISSGFTTSIDYKLTNNSSGYFLLYLTSNDQGTYDPITPFAVVELEKKDQGEILGTYDVKSQLHSESDITAIISCINQRLDSFEILYDTQEDILNDQSDTLSVGAEGGSLDNGINQNEGLKENDGKTDGDSWEVEPLFFVVGGLLIITLFGGVISVIIFRK